jgi:hypothetical protein
VIPFPGPFPRRRKGWASNNFLFGAGKPAAAKQAEGLVTSYMSADFVKGLVEDAMDPNRVISSPVKRLSDMSEEEIRKLELSLGARLSPKAKR